MELFLCSGVSAFTFMKNPVWDAVVTEQSLKMLNIKQVLPLVLMGNAATSDSSLLCWQNDDFHYFVNINIS